MSVSLADGHVTRCNNKSIPLSMAETGNHSQDLIPRWSFLRNALRKGGAGNPMEVGMLMTKVVTPPLAVGSKRFSPCV